MYLKLKNIRLVETEFGHDLVIKQVEVRDKEGKFLWHPKIDSDVVKVLHNAKIDLK
tara:strand:+ start:1690 stop:1857 length:168 start_codon:yes stop_codon:yes gene_type:complete